MHFKHTLEEDKMCPSSCEMQRWYQHQDTTDQCLYDVLSKMASHLSKSAATRKPEEEPTPGKAEASDGLGCGYFPFGFLLIFFYTLKADGQTV